MKNANFICFKGFIINTLNDLQLCLKSVWNVILLYKNGYFLFSSFFIYVVDARMFGMDFIDHLIASMILVWKRIREMKRNHRYFCP